VKTGQGIANVPIGSGVVAANSMMQHSSLSHRVAMGTTTISKEESARQIAQSFKSFETRTRRANDGAQPNNASDLSADAAQSRPCGPSPVPGAARPHARGLSKHIQMPPFWFQLISESEHLECATLDDCACGPAVSAPFAFGRAEPR